MFPSTGGLVKVSLMKYFGDEFDYKSNLFVITLWTWLWLEMETVSMEEKLLRRVVLAVSTIIDIE